MKKLFSLAMMGLSLLAFANSMFAADGGTKRIRVSTSSGATYIVEESASGTFTVVDVLAKVTKNGVTSEVSIAPAGVIGATLGSTLVGDNVTVTTLTFTTSGGAALSATQVASSLNAAVAATGGTAPTFTAANVTSGSATIIPSSPVVPGANTTTPPVDPTVRNVSPSN